MTKHQATMSVELLLLRLSSVLLALTDQLISNLLALHLPISQVSPLEAKVIQVLINKENSQPKLVVNEAGDLNAVPVNNQTNGPPSVPIKNPSQNPFIKKAKFTVKRVESGLKTLATSKSLALTFDVTEIRDQERLLAAQKKHDGYVKRITKIEKEITFLLNLLPPYNVEIDYATRTKITKAIEKLRMKQDELERKKYDLGMTISRLWRGHDESGVWVKLFAH